jgi:4-diphosphocytidyl-2-C-methyl-D-erythritol kinase
MIVFPHGKINLHLRVLGKRADGYHELETLFYPLMQVRDALEMLPASQVSLHVGGPERPSSLHVSGQDVPGDPATNLCLKAHALLSADFPAVRPVDIYLHKHIPIGAGLGGGSSDGAFALMLLNRLFRLGLTREQLLPYSAGLGSDCSFFLYDGACVAGGRGDILRPVELDLSGYTLVLVNPGIHVSTGWAFEQLGLEAGRAEYAAGTEVSGTYSAGFAGQTLPPITSWKRTFRNDFEPAVFAAHPEVGHIKNYLYEQGAIYASMSGSGSTVFGLFARAPVLSFPPHYWVLKAPWGAF